MQPSKALQDRLKGLKPSSPQLIEALPDEDLSSHSHRGENPQEGSLGERPAARKFLIFQFRK